MHEGPPESFELRLSHPFYQPREHSFGYCIKQSTYANCVTTTGSVNATLAPIKEEGPVVTGPTREFEGPVTEPTNELQEEPVAPTFMYDDSALLDSGTHNHISLDAAPSDPAALYFITLRTCPTLSRRTTTAFLCSEWRLRPATPSAASFFTKNILQVSLPLWVLTKVRLLPRPVKLLLTLVPWHNRRGVLGIRVESRERVTFVPTLMKRLHDMQQFHPHWTR